MLTLYFSSDVDIEFESGGGGGFELLVEDGVGSENEIIVHKYLKIEDDVEIGDSICWSRVGGYDSEEVVFGV